MKKLISIFILVCFLVTGQVGAYPVYAQEFRLPAPGVRVSLSPEYNPPILKGLKVHPENPFRFDFIMDVGAVINRPQGKGAINNRAIDNRPYMNEAIRLIKYFLASLTIPEKDLWVNLSPYEKDRIVPESFGQTEMGRDLLAEDYMLKQITASLIYPEDEIGKKFWKRIYEEAAKKFGTTNIPVNTFNKVWIVPEKAVVYENAKAGTAYVVESKLKVMLEQDYLALSHNVISASSTVIPAKVGIQNKNNINALGSQIVREIVIPELTKEVNEGKNFAQLRQVYNSLILATWYKKKIKDSILSQVYADKNKIAGVQYTSSIIPKPSTVIPAPSARGRSHEGQAGNHFKNDVEGLYQEYLKAFKKGVYNYIKEDLDPVTRETILRKYFSGGAIFGHLDQAMTIVNKIGQLPDHAMKIEAKFNIAIPTDSAMAAKNPNKKSKKINTSKKSKKANTSPGALLNRRKFLVSLAAAVVSISVGGWIYLKNTDSGQEVVLVGLFHPNNQEHKGLRDFLLSGEISAFKNTHNNAKMDATPIKNLLLARKEYLLQYRSQLETAEQQVEKDPHITALAIEGFFHQDIRRSSKATVRQRINKIITEFNKLFEGDNFVNMEEMRDLMLLMALNFNEYLDFKYGNKRIASLPLVPIEDEQLVNEHLRIDKQLNDNVGFFNSLYNRQLISKEEFKYLSELYLIQQGVYTINQESKNVYAVMQKILDNNPALSQSEITSIKDNFDSYVNYAAKFREKSEQRSYAMAEQILKYKGGILVLVGDKHLPEIEFKINEKGGAKVTPFSAPNRPPKTGQVLPQSNKAMTATAETKNSTQISSENPAVQRERGEEYPMSRVHLDSAMAGEDRKTGGVDFNVDKVNEAMTVKNNGGEIKFNIDHAMLEQLQNAPGFVPVIINIQPMTDLRLWLGLNNKDGYVLDT